MNHEAVLRREREAWEGLAADRCAADHGEAIDRWLGASRAFLDSQAQVTAVAVERATQALRDSAKLLADAAAPCAPPEPGARYVDREGSAWEVARIIADIFEPQYWIIELDRPGLRGVDPVNVLSEDWQLFCLLRRLRRC